jgi:aminoglycoside/choline kinase family phosphotransferase
MICPSIDEVRAIKKGKNKMLNVQQLTQWVSHVLDGHSGVQLSSNGTLELTPLTGDAGFRQYYRVNTTPPLLAVTAPHTEGVSESADYFSSLSSILRHQGIPTPMVLSCDSERNTLLIECFDGCDLFDELSDDTADILYGETLLILLRLQQIPRSQLSVVDYDRPLLMQEMALFREWFVGELLAYRLSDSESQLIDDCFTFLASKALEQPQVLVHRDYHSRNLLYREGEAPGVIDFQDAVWGPITYDLVSLLRDCYIRWSPERVQQWVLGYGNMAYELGLLPTTSSEQFLQWFDTMGLQRHIKVLGIFARLSLRDGKSRYLNDLPLVIRYVLEVANQHTETQAFAQWFETQLLPSIKTQPWYSDYLIAGDH